jgi:hypothetical protein
MVTAINLTAIIVSCLSLFVSITAIVLVVAQKMSTHQIEWRPLIQEKAEEEAIEEIKEQDQDDEKTLEAAINMQRAKKKKDQDPLEDILETSNYN